MLTDHLSNFLQKEKDAKETNNGEPWLLIYRIPRQRYGKDDKVQNVRSCDSNISCSFGYVVRKCVCGAGPAWPIRLTNGAISYLANVFHLLRKEKKRSGRGQYGQMEGGGRHCWQTVVKYLLYQQRFNGWSFEHTIIFVSTYSRRLVQVFDPFGLEKPCTGNLHGNFSKDATMRHEQCPYPRLLYIWIR
jgi:hypothetical protein